MRKLAVLLVLAALPALAQIPLPQAPTKYVTDAADVLEDEREHALNEKLAQYDRDTSNQVIVYVDRQVPVGTTIEEMGAEAIRTWQVGQVKKDNGAILFLFIEDRASRVEVGYGLEGVLTDAKSKGILVDMRPLLQDGFYTSAVEQGVQAILDTIAAPPPVARRVVSEPGWDTPAPSGGPPAFAFFLFFVFVFVFVLGLIVIIIKLVSDSRAFIQPNGASFPPPPDDSPRDSWTTFESSSSPSSSWDSSSSSSSSWDSSSSSSSDFSGDGGSGGGAGASDKW
ncbi:MAG TPA: TPM domain-containing protein [Thermoanaerobaculia bacterium]